MTRMVPARELASGQGRSPEFTRHMCQAQPQLRTTVCEPAVSRMCSASAQCYWEWWGHRHDSLRPAEIRILPSRAVPADATSTRVATLPPIVHCTSMSGSAQAPARQAC